jgi:hypothetical protein
MSIDSAWTRVDGSYHYFYNISLDETDSHGNFLIAMKELFGAPGARWSFSEHRYGYTVCFSNQDDAIIFKLVN